MGIYTDETKGLYIPREEDNFAFARDLHQRLSAIKIQVIKSIPGMLDLREYDNQIIGIMGFEKSDCWEDSAGNIYIHAFDAIFELHPSDTDDSYKLGGVYRKYDFKD